MKDIITKKRLKSLINDKEMGLTVYGVTDSTNTRAKELAKHPFVRELVVADSQTMGRGRLNRKFHSDGGVGIYMSLLTRFAKEASDFTLATVCAAVAVARALRVLTPLSPKIKWVNDIYVNGKKLSGILTEGSFTPEGKPDFCIIGIGINVYKREFDSEIRDIATTVEDCCAEPPERSVLIAEVVNQLLPLLENPRAEDILTEYRGLSILTNREVTVKKPDGEYPATVIGIDDDYSLILSLEDGSEARLRAGEVSIKL